MFSVLTLTLVAFISDVFAAPPILVLLSFEYFNPDFCSENSLSFFSDLRKEGAGPAFINPIFPLSSFTTHFTMGTGVRSDVHGIYNDLMFDSKGNAITPTKEHFQFNKEIVPIWTENEKVGNGRISGVMMWPGAEYEYHGVTPTYVQPYDPTIEWNKRAEMIVDWMTRSDKRANLVLARFEKNSACYNKYTKMRAANEYHKKIDNIIKYIYTNLTKKLGENAFNIVIMSDRGIQDITEGNVLKLEDCVTASDDVKVISTGSIVFIKIKEGTYGNVFNELKKKQHFNTKYKLFNRTEVQNQYGMNIPTLDNVIILLAKKKFAFFEKKKYEEILKDLGRMNAFNAELSGYDISNLEMTGYLAGFGPKFKKNLHTNNSFNVSDVYPMMKLVLDLPGSPSTPQNNVRLNDLMIAILVDDIKKYMDVTHNHSKTENNAEEDSENDGYTEDTES